MAARDYLNVERRSDLRDWVFQNGQCIAVLGVNTIADIPLETWYFDETSMAVDNGTNLALAFKPNDIPVEEPGRYLPVMVKSDWNNTINKPALFSGNYADLIGKPTILTQGIANNAAPALNTASVIHASKQASVIYSVSLAVTNPLLAGSSTATAYLEFSTNGTTWIVASQVSNSSSVGVAVAIQLTNTQTGILSGVIPAGAQRRVRAVTTGTANITMLAGQETY